MASLSSTMLKPEAVSSFLGTAMPTGVSSESRVTMMAYNRADLAKKPLALLRALARQQGVPITNKNGIIDALVKKGGYSYSSSLSYSAPPQDYSSSFSSYSSASGGDASQYQSMSLGELRALARSRGVRGDTKADIIKALLAAPAPAASSFGSSSNGAASASPSLPKEVLERKSLSELRALARIRGLRGDTKAELVKLLAAPASSNGAASSYTSSSNGAYSSPASTSYSSRSTPSNQVVARQLATKSMSQLRAMAAIKGIRGTTKDELVRQLASKF